MLKERKWWEKGNEVLEDKEWTFKGDKGRDVCGKDRGLKGEQTQEEREALSGCQTNMTPI